MFLTFSWLVDTHNSWSICHVNTSEKVYKITLLNGISSFNFKHIK